MDAVEGDVEFEGADEMFEELTRRFVEKLLEAFHLQAIAEKATLT